MQAQHRMPLDDAHAIAAVANKAAYVGAAGSMYGGFTANEIAAFGGLIVAVIGVLIQLYFKLRADRREAEIFRQRIERLRTRVDLDP
jgi:hypothetical protein